MLGWAAQPPHSPTPTLSLTPQDTLAGGRPSSRRSHTVNSHIIVACHALHHGARGGDWVRSNIYLQLGVVVPVRSGQGWDSGGAVMGRRVCLASVDDARSETAGWPGSAGGTHPPALLGPAPRLSVGPTLPGLTFRPFFMLQVPWLNLLFAADRVTAEDRLSLPAAHVLVSGLVLVSWSGFSGWRAPALPLPCTADQRTQTTRKSR